MRQKKASVRRSRRGLLAAAGSATAAGGVALAARLLRRRGTADTYDERRNYRLEDHETVAEGIRRVAAGQLDIALEHLREPADAHGEDIHEARKALKRSRALLRLSRDLVGPQVYRRENANLRDAGRVLSQLRDSQVLAETLEGLSSVTDDPLAPDTVLRLRRILVSPGGHSAGQDGKRAGLSSESEKRARSAAIAAIAQTRLRLDAWPLPEKRGLGALAPGFRKIYRQGRRALQEVEQEPVDERWHELRKRSKDLWYASQLLDSVNPRRARTLAQRAHRLSTFLGDDHDLAILEDHATHRAADLGLEELSLLSAAVRRRRSELQLEALRLAQRVYAQKPGELLRQLQLA